MSRGQSFLRSGMHRRYSLNMSLTVRAGALWASLAFLLIGLVGWSGGCISGHGGGGAPATTTATTKKADPASTKPVDETVTIELNERWIDFAPRARGVPATPTCGWLR